MAIYLTSRIPLLEGVELEQVRDYLRNASVAAANVASRLPLFASGHRAPDEYYGVRRDISHLVSHWRTAARDLRRIANLPAADEDPQTVRAKIDAWGMRHFPGFPIYFTPIDELSAGTEVTLLPRHRPLLDRIKAFATDDQGRSLYNLTAACRNSVMSTYHRK